MKNKVFALLSLTLIGMLVAGLFVACGSQPAATTSTPAQPIKLRFSTPYTPAERIVVVAGHWADLVEQRSNGRVTIERYDSESLGKSAEHLEMVKTGTADVVQLVPALYATELPLNSFINFAGAWGVTQQKALENTLKFSEIPEVKAILEAEGQRQNFILFGWMTLGPYGTVSRVPVTRLEDLKGYKINGSPMNTPIYEHYGIVPVNVAIADAYESFSKGVIDAYNSSTFGVYGLKVWENAKYYREMPRLGIGTPMLFNLKEWNSLPPDIQEIILQAGKEMSLESVKVFDDIVAEAWEAYRAAGLDVGYYPKENQDVWNRLSWVNTIKGTWYGIATKAGYQAEADTLMKYYQEVWGPQE